MAEDALAELEERVAGVADRWNLPFVDNGYEPASLFVSGLAGGCSVVWLPPEQTTTGKPLLTAILNFGCGRAQRGDVRTAILLLLSGEPVHGYQIMQAMSDRAGGAWHPSLGAIYPVIAQLEDVGLVTTREEAAAAWSLSHPTGVHNWRSAAPD